MTIGENIQKRRKAFGLTQKELAEKVGVAPITIQQYERNVRIPKIEILKKIGMALGFAEWYELYPEISQKAVPATDDARLAAACNWLNKNLNLEQRKAKERWSIDKRENWLNNHYQYVADMYNISAKDVEKSYVMLVSLDEIPDDDIDKTEEQFKSKIFDALKKLNLDGQKIAAERVQELTEIPRYQLDPATAQTAADDVTNKDPDKK